MFFVYILETQESKRFYIGQTNNLLQRIKRHNQGRNLSTRAFIPWSLKWWKEYQTRTEAVRVEKTLKGIKKELDWKSLSVKLVFRGVVTQCVINSIG